MMSATSIDPGIYPGPTEYVVRVEAPMFPFFEKPAMRIIKPVPGILDVGEFTADHVHARVNVQISSPEKEQAILNLDLDRNTGEAKITFNGPDQTTSTGIHWSRVFAQLVRTCQKASPAF